MDPPSTSSHLRGAFVVTRHLPVITPVLIFVVQTLSAPVRVISITTTSLRGEQHHCADSARYCIFT